VSLVIEDTEIKNNKLNYVEIELPEFHNLQSLEIVNCNLDTFTPKRLSRFLESLSLEGNNLRDLEAVRFQTKSHHGRNIVR
jgi:Leucine-rich repeat (LRR) protein